MITISCSEEENSNPPNTDNSITSIVSRTKNLSLLSKALLKTGLDARLKETTELFTLFAPTNEAFIEAGYNTTQIDDLSEIEIAQLKEILLNHVVSGSLQTLALTTGYKKTFAKASSSSTNNLSIFINNSAGIKLNGVATINDIKNGAASNGVIHQVDKIIPLPTITTHINANPDFSSLLGLLNRENQPDFETILEDNSGIKFTLFTPKNSAFTDLNTELESSGGIAAITADEMTQILNYHVVSGDNLSSSFTNNQIISPILTPQQSFTIQLISEPFSLKIKDISNRDSNITLFDIQCTNGIMHVIDKVLLPNF